MKFLNYNGKFFEEGTPIITADSRGLRYGDGLFETIKYKNKECILLQEHLSRLWSGLSKLQFDRPKLFTPEFLEDEIEKLVHKNKETAARIRLNIFKGKGGLYDAENHHPNFVIQTMPLKTDGQVLNSNGLQLCIYRDALKIVDSFSNLKHNNFLPYTMGAQFAKQQKCNDAIILNQHHRVSDSSIANIFLVKDGVLYTPALSEGCVAGIMRKFVLESLPELEVKVVECSITEDTLMDADEVFLSNSIYNIRWVAGINEKQYSNEVTKDIFGKLATTNPGIIC